jgi:hypothetical protein
VVGTDALECRDALEQAVTGAEHLAHAAGV